jgi:hypothetical protein
MNIQDMRIFWLDNTTLKDITISVTDYKSNSIVIDYKSATDYIFIGADMPFNHLYMDLKVVNAESATASVDIWYSNAWESAVDIIDQTAVSGVPLAQSNYFTWNTNRLKSWDRELDSFDVTGLAGTKIYNKFWARLKFSEDLTNTLEFNYIGNRFSDDDDLYSYYPDLNRSNIKTAYETGKTDWKEQSYDAAAAIIAELKSKDIIFSPGQILNHEVLRIASAHKTAEIIYMAFGRDYMDKMQLARQLYNEAMSGGRFQIDLNQDGRLSLTEKSLSTFYGSR